jgi:hypothetical protein
MLQLTKKDATLLMLAVLAGAGDDGIENLGLSKREQYQLGKIANRLADLAGWKGPRFYETE